MQEQLKQALRQANERIIQQEREIRKLRIVNDLMSEKTLRKDEE